MNDTLNKYDCLHEMNKLSNQMAAFFNARISDKELIIWQNRASDIVFDYYQNGNGKKAGESSPGNSFLGYFSDTLFTNILEAKNIKDRKAALKDSIPDLFSGFTYTQAKESLSEIGKAFFFQYEKYAGHDQNQIIKFMKYLGYFMHLCEIYSEYEFYEKEESKKAV